MVGEQSPEEILSPEPAEEISQDVSSLLFIILLAHLHFI